MEDDTGGHRSRRRPWFRRHRFDVKHRSRSEMTLCRDGVNADGSPLVHYSSTGRLNFISTEPPRKSTFGNNLRQAFLVGKRPHKSDHPVGPGARIGYALAYTGAKMGLIPFLSSESILRINVSSDYHRSIAVQTDSHSFSGREKTDPPNGVVPSGSGPYIELDPSSPLYACLAPFISMPHVASNARQHGLSKKTFTSVGTSSCEPFTSEPCSPHGAVATEMSQIPLPVILTEEQRSPSPSVHENYHEETSGAADGTYHSLLHPLECFSITRRKSSTGDSAVDLKFGGDEERSVHSGGPPSPLTPSTPSDAEQAARSADEEGQRSQTFKEYEKEQQQPRRSSSASWRKLRNVMIWAPFIQQYQRHRYPWIQLAGHQGNFRAGEQGTILKKHCYRECTCLKALMDDQLRPYIPEFKGEVVKENDRYVCMQDLLMEFESPSLMDCKLGLRTYLEEELTKAKSTPAPRKDMYEKMIEVDPGEPTEDEHQLGAVTKPRYMQWRETLSSTATLGFRIEGIKQLSSNSVESNGVNSEKAVAKSNNDFKRLKSRDDVKACLKDYTDGNVVILEKYLTRLRSIAATLEVSDFFKKHELIGSSLLFVHDHRCKVNIWMIDFGKTMPLPDGVTIDHRSEWIEGNHEDGYLFGLENMTTIFEELLAETSVSSSLNQLAASTLKAESMNSHSTSPSVSRGDS